MSKFKITAAQAKNICLPLLTDIELNHFQMFRTRSGAVAILFTRAAGGTHPLLGAFYSSNDLDENGEWYSAQWSVNGKFNPKVNSALDLMGIEPVGDLESA